MLFPNRLSVCQCISNNNVTARARPHNFCVVERHYPLPVADELRRSCFGTGDTLANSQSNSTLALLPFPVASGLTAAVNNTSSLKKSRLPVTPRFLQTDESDIVAAHLLVHIEDLRRSAHAVLSIHSHRPHVMGSDGEFPSASSVTVVARLSSCCAPSRSPSAPLFSTKFFVVAVIFIFCT